jgi:6-phosphogluconolactonase
MAQTITVTYRVFSGRQEFTRGAAAYYAEALSGAGRERAQVRAAFSGGNTPRPVFELLGERREPYREQVPWDKLEFFFVDERTVDPTSNESNYGIARAALFNHVPLQPAQIHRMQGELDPEEAAAKYESAIRNAFRLEGAEMPRFDVISLGMGDDGHTASLFPHTAAIHELGRIVVANQVPQKQTWRITLTWPVINQARDVSFMIMGEDKAEVLNRVLLGDYDPETLPSQLIRPSNGKLMLLLDERAAARLPRPEPNGDGVLEGTLEITR